MHCCVTQRPVPEHVCTSDANTCRPNERPPTECDIRAWIREEVQSQLERLADAISKDAANRELVMGQRMCTAVYDRVISDVNANVVPLVNNMTQWVNYAMQDGDELADDYRRTIEDNLPRLRDDEIPPRDLTPNIRFFF